MKHKVHHLIYNVNRIIKFIAFTNEECELLYM